MFGFIPVLSSFRDLSIPDQCATQGREKFRRLFNWEVKNDASKGNDDGESGVLH